VVSGVSVINAAANPFGANFNAANAANGVAGRSIGPGVEYASNTGTNMFVDFDMGAIQPITGFDFFDRIAAVDRIGSFDLIFSNDSSFGSSVATRSYTKGTGGVSGTGPWTLSDSFAPISARYVRFDSTSAAAGGGNLGINDMIFYAVPEPASAAMAGLAGLALLRRRRA
jgi:MYXO-CTERM domain-containing protein